MSDAASNKSLETRVLAEAIIMIALAVVLFTLKIFTFPQGGEVTLGSMTPIILLSLRRGARVGVFAGLVFGMIVLYLEPFIYNVPWQVMLDYPLAYGAIGLSGLVKYRPPKWEGAATLKEGSFFVPMLGPVIGISGRFACHLLSGVIFFSSYAPAGENVWEYSAIYNISYLLPEFIITEVFLFLLLQRNILAAFR